MIHPALFLSKSCSLFEQICYDGFMATRRTGELEEYIKAHPDKSQVDIAADLGVSRQAVSAMMKKMGIVPVPSRAARSNPMDDPNLPPVPIAVEKPAEDGENFLATEGGKTKLAVRIGSKMEMILDSMTPEKAARCTFKDLAIAFGVMTDKQRQINDATSSGQGLLAAALIKAVAQQIGCAMKESLPEPTQVIPAEGVVVDA